MQKALEALRQCLETGEFAERPDLLVDMETITRLVGYERVSALENELLSAEALERKYGGAERDYVIHARKD
jgi:hypothetical protein